MPMWTTTLCRAVQLRASKSIGNQSGYIYWLPELVVSSMLGSDDEAAAGSRRAVQI